MPYVPTYFTQNAPEGWRIGDPIPAGYEDSEINAANLHAFAADIYNQVLAAVLANAVQALEQDPETGEYPERPADAALAIWVGWTNPNDVASPPNQDMYVPIPEPT